MIELFKMAVDFDPATNEAVFTIWHSQGDTLITRQPVGEAGELIEACQALMSKAREEAAA